MGMWNLGFVADVDGGILGILLRECPETEIAFKVGANFVAIRGAVTITHQSKTSARTRMRNSEILKLRTIHLSPCA